MSIRPPGGHRISRLFVVTPARVRRSSRRAVAGAAVLSLVATWAAAPARSTPWSVERYLGGDGHRITLTDPRLGDGVRETARHAGIGAFVDGPFAFLGAVGTLEDARRRSWFVETVGFATVRDATLFWLDGTGLHRPLLDRGSDGDASTVALEPALLELPADPTSTPRFGSSGRILGSAMTWRDEGNVTAAGDFGTGCLRISHRLLVGAEPARESSSVRCPGIGLVAERSPQPGVDWVRGTTVLKAEPALFPTPLRPGMTPAGSPILRGGQPLVLTAQYAVSAPGGAWIANQASDNLVRIYEENHRAQAVATVHPGGQITLLAACGDTMVAGTTDRRLVAYSLAGDWQWTTELGEVARAEATRVEDDLLVTTDDQTVRRISCRTGTVEWSRSGIGSEAAPGADADRVVSAAGGRVRLLDRGGQTRWEQNLPAGVRHVSLAADRVLVADDDGWVHGFAEDGGKRLWSVRLKPADGLHLLDGVLAVRTSAGVDALDPLTGGRLWSVAARAGEAVDDGALLWLHGDAEQLLIDRGGRVLERRGTRSPAGQVVATLLSDDGVLMIDPQTLHRWR